MFWTWFFIIYAALCLFNLILFLVDGSFKKDKLGAIVMILLPWLYWILVFMFRNFRIW